MLLHGCKDRQIITGYIGKKLYDSRHFLILRKPKYEMESVEAQTERCKGMTPEEKLEDTLFGEINNAGEYCFPEIKATKEKESDWSTEDWPPVKVIVMIEKYPADKKSEKKWFKKNGLYYSTKIFFFKLKIYRWLRRSKTGQRLYLWLRYHRKIKTKRTQ